jgi:extracellular elastinolytic metalloproteinase
VPCFVAFRGQQVSAQTSGKLNLNAEYDDSLNPNNRNNIVAATTNAFYINTLHDVTYRYGFTEAAFNFQQDNLGKGGRARDRVQISVQDASGTNNANFATPPEYVPLIL